MRRCVYRVDVKLILNYICCRTLDQWSVVMEDRCSNNFRLWVCGALLPACETGYKPCKEGCKFARKECRQKIIETRIFGSKRNGNPRLLPKNVNLKRKLKCKQFKNANANSSECTVANPRRRRQLPQLPFNYCEQNTIALCEGLPFTRGSLPNLFRQTLSQVEMEIENYRDFIESECHPHVRLFVCGVYKPFCPTNQFPIVMPCKGLCDDVKTSCEEEFQRLFPEGPWPTKLQCHRYPIESSLQRPCFNGSDTDPVWDQEDRPRIE